MPYVDRMGFLNMEPWLEFLDLMAAHYKGLGVNYEIEKEIDRPGYWPYKKQEYLDFAKACYKTIKKNDPQAKVISSAVGCGILLDLKTDDQRDKEHRRHNDWLGPILANKAFDVVSVHDYYFPSEITANGLTFAGYLEGVRKVMKEVGVEDRPLWITETGFVSAPTSTLSLPTPSTPSTASTASTPSSLTSTSSASSPTGAGGRIDEGSPEKQANWLKEGVAQAFEGGAEKIFWRRLSDGKEPYFGTMGLTDEKGNPRPAWNEFQRLVKERDKQ